MTKAFKIVCVTAIVASLGSVASADSFGTGPNAFTIEFVTISGDAGGANGTAIGSGKTFTDPGDEYPDGEYRMGVYEITKDQWDKFEAALPVPVTGFPSSAYQDAPTSAGPNAPVNNTSWYEAAQFVNWLNTSRGKHVAYRFAGTQGIDQGIDIYYPVLWDAADADGSNLYRHKDAFYFLPTEDEWVKAAYWNEVTLAIQPYANVSPGDLVAGLPDPAKWNYDASAGSAAWNVGSGSEELNGTYDMMGNLNELMESPYTSGDYEYDDSQWLALRGGVFNQDDTRLPSSDRRFVTQDYEGFTAGFRVASIPEPCSLGLLALGGLAVLRRRRR